MLSEIKIPTFRAQVWNESVVVTRVHNNANATRRCIGRKFCHKGHRSAHAGLASVHGKDRHDLHGALMRHLTMVKHAFLDSDLYSLGS
jgi:hypothetical protein